MACKHGISLIQCEDVVRLCFSSHIRHSEHGHAANPSMTVITLRLLLGS